MLLTNESLCDYAKAQALLGHISRSSVKTLIKSGELKAVKIGRRTMIPLSEIHAYIQRLKEQQ